MPERIQMSRQTPWRAEHPKAIKVDRSTVYGNPFKVGFRSDTSQGEVIVASVEQAVQLHRDWLEGRIEISQPRPHISYLRGNDLACWCGLGSPCHADTLLELANTPLDEHARPLTIGGVND